ncbi:MAG: HypC/HybG/HupF family hydrogenase formation chaperone [Chloroflexi bacterium]|jgi:hydrogenase expression/formation protein HypC|nr:HypC/HybG/HupF family hydrogenase formation chaperone [Chloroflexota bacterium]MBT3670354.1 HypC/HybG/HupF family hydrogenase formation chaperone [Chloroflexota bacterium]MBT4002271.1 HypC/HybG/HupF family hydrogenase formation chaperone [Chloroflexota bacterium]MBT4305541.1 HypC/HybG/HupF family hydrogenase formation chaperone [Chloroflexota bacterium]MBT4533153.1 HypC/HybG/HupF family hydrogenase formation chaperone [Chloroflexota bacterium]
MCLGVPGKVIELYEVNGMKMGKVDFGGAIKEACFEYLPEIEVGSYAIIHVGFGLSEVDEEEVEKTYELFREIESFSEKLPDPKK